MCAVTILVVGCATVHVDPALYEQKSFVIASVYARKNIVFNNVPVAPMLYDNELGSEVLEMELGDTEARLSEILGVDVVPAGKALEQKKVYDHLPETFPPDDFTRVNEMIAVDTGATATPTALGELAHALGVDAAVVLKHEWALARDRFEVAGGLTAFDRCTLLIADKSGRILWDDVVIVRIPVEASAYAVDMNGATWADEARQLSRRTGREALDELARRYRAGRPHLAKAAPP